MSVCCYMHIYLFICLFQIRNLLQDWLYVYSYQVVKSCNFFNPRTQMSLTSKCQDFSLPLFPRIRIRLMFLMGFLLLNLHCWRSSSHARISCEAHGIPDGQCSCCDRSVTWADSYRCNISHQVCRTGLSLFVLLMHW